MIFPYITPILGIVSEQDRACAEMLAVVVGASNKLVWTYIRTNPKWIPFSDNLAFVPLSAFYVRAWFTPTGLLAVTHYSPLTRALYHSGEPRAWQGAQQETIRVHPDIVRYVHEVVAREAEARRVRA